MYNEPDNYLRDILLRIGVLIYRLGLVRVILKLSRNRVRALLYHAVENHESSYTQRLGVSVSASMFDANLAFFAKYYNVVPVNDLNRGNLPDNPLVITFDDGYKSVYQNAFPLLKKHQLPACVYLISRAVENKLVWVNELNTALVMHRGKALEMCHEFPDLRGVESRGQIISIVQNSFSPANINLLSQRLNTVIDFDPNHGLYASPTDIAEMQSGNIVFGFHTRDHYNLRNCNREELKTQLDNSEISELLDSSTFAYPFGYFNPDAVLGVSTAGYQKIMTVGNNNNRFSARHLDRIEVFSSDPAVVFAKIEVVEPVITVLRGWVMNYRKTRKRLRSILSPVT